MVAENGHAEYGNMVCGAKRGAGDMVYNGCIKYVWMPKEGQREQHTNETCISCMRRKVRVFGSGQNFTRFLNVSSMLQYIFCHWEKLIAADCDDDEAVYWNAQSLSLFPTPPSLCFGSFQLWFTITQQICPSKDGTRRDKIIIYLRIYFVTISTSRFPWSWIVPEEGFFVVCFCVLVLSLSMSLPLSHALYTSFAFFQFCCFSFVSKSHFSFIYKTIHQNSIKSVV